MDRNADSKKRLSESPRSWHVVQLKPGGAALAERNLTRQGFQTFFPRLTAQRRSGGRLVRRSEPLFPGYGFVAVPPGASWAPINSTYGVARLLAGMSRRPAPLPAGFVDALRRRCDEEGHLAQGPELAPGDQVRITAAPFDDLVARIEQLEALGRVTVLLDLLGRPVRVSLRRSDVVLETAPQTAQGAGQGRGSSS